MRNEKNEKSNQGLKIVLGKSTAYLKWLFCSVLKNGAKDRSPYWMGNYDFSYEMPENFDSRLF